MPTTPTIPAADNPFSIPYEATQDTVWVMDPADPVNSRTGPIRQGEIIWFQADRFGSGPVWQSARLDNDLVCFVQPHHFELINP